MRYGGCSPSTSTPAASAESRFSSQPIVTPSSPSAQELLDRPKDRLAVGNPAAHDVLLRALQLVDVLVELARAVRALHLPVAEQVDARQELLLQDLQAVRDVVAPVVAVGEVEGVDVALVGQVAGGDDLVAQRVGR